MGPFVGPATSALLAAVLAGVVLGVLRLSRVSLNWWRRRQARIAEPMPAFESADAGGSTTAALAPFRVFPRITSALACASSAALLVLLGALATEHAPGITLVPPALQVPAWDAAAFGRAAATRTGGALIALAATLVAALVVAAFDRGLEALFARVAPRLGRAFPGRFAAADGDSLFSFRDLRAGASGLWHPDTVHGESFGVGLGYVILFASPVLAMSVVGASVFGEAVPAGALLVGVAFLLVPCAYAAAAERSPADDMGLLRQRAALRQIVAAPAWALALVALLAVPRGAGSEAGHLLAWIALVLAVLAGLPGTSLREQAVLFHRGGDFPEPSAPVRAISGVAHHAWVAAWALFVAQAWLAAYTAPTVLLGALVVIALFLGVRAALLLVGGGRLAPWFLAAAVPLAVLDLALHRAAVVGAP